MSDWMVGAEVIRDTVKPQHTNESKLAEQGRPPSIALRVVSSSKGEHVYRRGDSSL